MAYIGTLPYDTGGRVRSLNGMGVVTYDSGTTRNLLGANLGAVKYDDGGRFRTLVGGLGDCNIDPDTGIVTGDCGNIPTTIMPVGTGPVSPVPSVYIPPNPNIQTTSAPITGTLTPPPSSPGTVVALAQPVTGVLDNLFNSIKQIFSPSSANPATAVPAGTGWGSQATIVSGIPNWEVATAGLVGIGLVAMLAGGGGGGRRRRRNPGRHRNPMELVLMGANPSYSRLRRRR